MSVILKGGASGDLANVTAAKELSVALPANPAAAGYVHVSGADGTPIGISPGTGYVFTGSDQMVFSDQVDGAALNANIWSAVVTTQTVTQTGGMININATLSTAANGAAQITSQKWISLLGGHPIFASFMAIVPIGAQNNATVEFGLGIASGTTAPTDGFFFRYSSNGNFIAVINNGGVETTSEPIATPTLNEAHEYVMLLNNRSVMFVIDRIPVAVVAAPNAQPFPVSGARLPVFARTYNGASVPAEAPRLQIGQVLVSQSLLNLNRDWKIALAALGRGGYQSPTAFTQIANHTNSLGPVSATLANTTAGYATLGGKFQFAAVAGAVTDFALFAYLVPVGYQLFITSIRIHTHLEVVAIATTPTILDWSLAVNSSAISLATPDAATTWSPRRIPVGSQGFPLLAPSGPYGPGDAPDNITVDFQTPVVVDSARYAHVILQVPTGTATATQLFRGAVTIAGYFE